MGWFVLGLLVAVAYWPGLPAAELAPRWAVIAVGVPLLARFTPQREMPTVIVAALIWMIGLAAVSLIVSPDRYGGAGDFLFILILTSVFVASAREPIADLALKGVAFGLLFSSALCIWQAFGGRPVDQGTPMPSGLFYNSEVLAELAAIIFVWAVVRPCWWAALGASVPLLLCHSRIAVLVVALGLAYAWIGRWWLRALCFGLIGIAGLGALWFFGIGKLGSAFERLVIWGAMAEAIVPLGRGLGWVYLALPRQQFAHSDGLQTLVELGFGAVALAVIPVYGFWRGGGSRAERAAFFAACAEVLVSFPLRLPASGFVAALLAGAVVGGGAVVRGRVSGSRASDGRLVFRAPASAWRGAISRRRSCEPVPVRPRSAGVEEICCRGSQAGENRPALILRAST